MPFAVAHPQRHLQWRRLIEQLLDGRDREHCGGSQQNVSDSSLLVSHFHDRSLEVRSTVCARRATQRDDFRSLSHSDPPPVFLRTHVFDITAARFYEVGIDDAIKYTKGFGGGEQYAVHFVHAEVRLDVKSCLEVSRSPGFSALTLR